LQIRPREITIPANSSVIIKIKPSVIAPLVGTGNLILESDKYNPISIPLESDMTWITIVLNGIGNVAEYVVNSVNSILPGG